MQKVTSGQYFKSRTRKIAPFELPEHPGAHADYTELDQFATQKAANFNQHVIGYGDLAESEWADLGLTDPDLPRMRRYRLDRVRQQLIQQDVAGVLLYDPLNIRYATDTTNMQLWCTHNAVRYAFVATDGPVILWDFHHCEHLSAHVETVDEVRHGTPWFYFEAGPRMLELAERWAAELADVITETGAGNHRLAIDKLDPIGTSALAAIGIEAVDGDELMETARSIKSADEIKAMRRSIATCETAMRIMEDSLQPGMSENDLWAVLHAENVRRGGEWIETRLLSSGPRTNPWFQESSARIIEDGDLVSFDTDLVGPYGYCCDISRTWLAGDGIPTNEQRTLYQIALEQIETNTQVVGPGKTFQEISDQAFQLPEIYLPNRYSCVFHGVGLCDEFPSLPYPEDWEKSGFDGVLEPGMVVCVESYVGAHGGHEGVKLEDQVLITEDGRETLSRYPMDVRLSGRAG